MALITTPSVSLDDIRAAAERIAPHAVRTPLLQPHALRGGRHHQLQPRTSLYLKPENLQRVGAFKFRGAFNTLACLRETDDPSHVITSSSGNHGQAVACAGQILGIRVTVVMPENAVRVKVDAVRGYGGEVVFAGTASPEREAQAREIGAETGGTVIGSFDDARIIAGQGTIGLEILADLPDADTIVVPVGGGGLISGIAIAAKTMKSDLRVVGVEPEGASDAYQSLRAGRRLPLDHVATIADGLRTSCPGVLNFEIMRRLVDEIVLVSDQQIRDAMRVLALDVKLTVEPSGAVAVAALLSGAVPDAGASAVAVISGGNVDPAMLAAVLAP